MLLKPIRLKKPAWTQSAKGEGCQIRIPGVCNNNPETVVACHLNGGGMGGKASDLFIAYGCSDCHDVVDKRTYTNIPSMKLERWMYEAVFKTQQILINKGLIK